ncbi:MAG: glycosyl transferase family 36 [Dictyoglomus sp. NZ13-RE01]|nr:MAG: glycosyl transferase family 36 [Dictyoglomus sp. NZ13-RE01]
MERLFETKYGYFKDNGKEYVIKTPKTPRPWVNVISNGDYGLVISNTGSSYSFRTHASLNRITRWNQDLIKDDWGKYIYIRDNETKEFWSIPWKPVCKDYEDFELIHGIGYSIFNTKYYGIRSEFTIFVPINDPVEIWLLRIKNESSKTKHLSLFTYLEWNLGASPDWHREFHKTFIETYFNKEGNYIFSKKRLWEIPNEKGQHWNRDWEYTAFHWANIPAIEAEGSKEEFIGMFGDLKSPKALIEGRLTNTFGKWEDDIASLRIDLTLNPLEEKTIVFALGAIKNNSDESIERIVERYNTEDKVEKALIDVKKMWEDLLSKTMVETPDPAFNIMNNYWLKYQAISGRLWARTAYYQLGGAYGFRDQLQDSQIFLYLNPERTKDQIKLHARHQFSDGYVYHWWHPISEIGHRNEISDNRLWLPFLVIRYLKNTDDWSILHEMIPYLDGRSGTLYEHCCKAIDLSLKKFSNRGLPLIGDGDWNDGMNAVGTGGKGESIWLAHFLYGILIDFAKVSEKHKDYERVNYYLKRAEELKEAINSYGWDGEWYIRAFKDSGEPIGSKACKEGKIFLNAQTWAILNDTAPEERKKKAYNSAKNYLFREFGPLLFYPAYTSPDPEIGYLTRYAPGVRENGGLYTHAGCWAVLASCKMKDRDAYKIYKSFMPIYRGLEPDLYKAEPYVTCGNVDGPDSKYFGRGGWSWYTGSACWYFISAMEGILGIIPTWEGLKIDPNLPEDWNEVKVKRLFRGKVYEISIKRLGKFEIFLEGERIEGDIVNYQGPKDVVKVEVYI